MRRFRFMVLILVVFVVYGAVYGAEVKQVVMVIASKNFRDEEYMEPRKILEKGGYKVVVASSSLEVSKGMLGLKVKPDILIDKLAVKDGLKGYEAVIFVGGTGAKEYWDSKVAHTVVREAVKHKKVLAAICIGPVILAKAGALKGVKATVWESEAGQLKNLGAKYMGEGAFRDGKIVTASGPNYAKKFGEEILKALKG